MAILDIIKYPHPALQKRSKAVEVITEEECRLIENMIQAMRKNQGAGLAAPQVGVLKRIIVIEAVENFKEPVELINPNIIKRKGRCVFCEGCLSLPDVEGEVVRAREVSVEALNKRGGKILIKAKGLFARIIQHEIDHLDGILFINRLGFLKRRKILSKFKTQQCVKL